MTFPETSLAVKIFAIGSALLTACVLVMLLLRAKADQRRTAAVTALFFCYYTALGFAAYGGLLADFSSFPPRLLVPLVTLPLLSMIAVVLSAPFGRFLSGVSIVWLTGFQMFRFFAEALIAWLALENAMPETMTISGRNFDLFAPVTAPVAALLFSRSTRGRTALALLGLWNAVAAMILVNTVATAVLSMPTPGRVFFEEPALTAPALFPFYLLPAFFVPLAFALHAASFRRIAQMWAGLKDLRASAETLQAQ